MKIWFFRRMALGLLAGLTLAAAAHAAEDFLEPEQAFRLSARALDDQHIEVRFDIAPGYYLYRERFNAEASPASVQLGELQIPKGHVKFDETFQKNVEYYRDSTTMVVPLQAVPKAPFKLLVGNQGCADKGLCYSPMQRALNVEPGQAGGLMTVSLVDEKPGAASVLGSSTPAATAAAPAVPSPSSSGAIDESGRISGALRSGNLLAVIGLFLLLGLGLSFTPCVLPMMPILSSIIVGQGGHVSKARGFSLALAYSLGMAMVYTAVGVASALAGAGLGAALQNVWVLTAFATLLAVLSLSMFGVYELQMPASVQNRLSEASQRIKGGQHVGVFVMGGLSALIVGPCVAAPLAGALVYISQTRDVVLGGTALFSLAAGMSVPLLLLGLSAGALLPRAGAWMTHVKHGFGVMLLAVALWMISPVTPTWALMLLTAVLLLVCAVYLGAFERLPTPVPPGRTLAKGLGLALGVLATVQLVGAASGGREWLRPLAHLRSAETVVAGEAHSNELKFQTIANIAELDAAVRASTKPVMLDFYADWCVSCKEFEALTFTDGGVRQKMAGLTLLRADVTANSEQDKALMRKYTLFGPPALLFFAPAGSELAEARVIGFQPADKFSAHLDRVDAMAGARVSLN